MNRFEALVESFDPRDSHPWLRIGRARVAGRAWPGVRPGLKTVVRIRPEDVLLCAAHPGRVSARNVLAARTVSLRRVPDGFRVTVDVGFPLTALVTRRAVVELDLRRGTSLYAVVKATAVLPEVAVEPRLRVSVVGPRGTIGPDRLDLLRAIDETGSMAAAARAAGIGYRTAWLWVDGVETAWGSSLVHRTRGGRGGGGAVLSPEGRALVELAGGVESRARRR